MDKINSIMNQIADRLSQVGGIQAIVLGGSRARGTNTPSSDIDIGIYYDADALDLDALNQASKEMDDEHRENLIAPPGGWGEWVNGGGWLAGGLHFAGFGKSGRGCQRKPEGERFRPLSDGSTPCVSQCHILG